MKPNISDSTFKPRCPSIQDGCASPELCISEGCCHYTGSPFLESCCGKTRLVNAPCPIGHNCPHDRAFREVEFKPGWLNRDIERARDSIAADQYDNARMVKALREILKVTGATHDRPYTALSIVDGLARDGLR